MMTMPTIRGAPRYHRGSEGHGVSPYHFGVFSLTPTPAQRRSLTILSGSCARWIRWCWRRFTQRGSGTRWGFHSRDLANKVPGAVYFETLPEVTTYLRRVARPDDVILTVGAGDIYQAGEALLKQKVR